MTPDSYNSLLADDLLEKKGCGNQTDLHVYFHGCHEHATQPRVKACIKWLIDIFHHNRTNVISLLFAIAGKLTFTLAGTMNEMKPIILLQTPEGFEVTRKLHSVVALMVEYASAH